MPTRTIYLVRHGQEDRTNRPDSLEGPLTRLGIKQAQATGEWLRHVPFDCAHVSTLRRASQTADQILKFHADIPVEHTKMLWECIPSVPPELENDFREITPKQLLKMQSRITRAYDKYFVPSAQRKEASLIVAHGNLIRFFVGRVLDIPEHNWIKLDIHNSSITVIEVKPSGRTVLVTHNSVAHMPHSLHTFK